MKTFDFTEDFKSIFTGNEGFYVENNIPKDTKTKKGAKVKTEVYFRKHEVTERLYALHLAGEKGLGVCPITDDALASFGVIDIDDYSSSVAGVVQAIYNNNLPLLPCRSKSGGLHIYLLLQKPVQAKSVIRALKEVSDFLGLEATFKDKVEYFPKQAVLSPGTQGNCITLPYYNADDPVSYLYSATMQAVPAEDAIRLFKRTRTTVTSLHEAMEGAELSDAPCCVQSIILTSALGENSGRNNFLFTCAVYLRKKYGDEFRSYLEEFNTRLRSPITAQEIDAIVTSVSGHEYNYKCKDIPCKTYCKKVACSKREYGAGNDKGHFSGLEYGNIIRVLAAEPYYMWKLKRQDDEGDFKTIIFKDETSLMDQKFFGKLCIRHLNFVPSRMKDNDWYAVLNTILPKIEEQTVDRATDTTLKAELYETFLTYITQKKAGADKPVQVKMGFAHKSGNKYFFTKNGFQRYLDVSRIKYAGENIRELLLSFGAKADELVYEKAHGQQQRIACWSKEVDNDVLEREVFYDDVIDADEEALEALRASEEGEPDAEAMF